MSKSKSKKVISPAYSVKEYVNGLRHLVLTKSVGPDLLIAAARMFDSETDRIRAHADVRAVNSNTEANEYGKKLTLEAIAKKGGK
jgi:hypothetical protein